MFTMQRLDTGAIIDLDEVLTEGDGILLIDKSFGYPEVREVVDLYPDNHGVIDNTALFGVRVLSVQGVITGPDADAKAMELRGYSLPSLRSTLRFEYQGIEVSTTGRTANLDLKRTVGGVYSFTFQWKCQPFFLGATQSLAAGYTGSSTTPTDLFPMSFPFAFISGSSTLISIVNGGQVPIYPSFTIHGSITKPVITNMTTGQQLAFGTTATVPAGQALTVDLYARTAYLGDGTSFLPLIDFSLSEWFSVGLNGANVKLDGIAPGANCQLVANWNDLYL